MSDGADFVEFATMRTRLAAAVEMAGSQSAWARKHGISRSEVCDTLKGRRDPSEAIINQLGYVRREVYVPMRGQNT